MTSARCPTCGTCPGGRTCKCPDHRCPCWRPDLYRRSELREGTVSKGGQNPTYQITQRPPDPPPMRRTDAAPSPVPATDASTVRARCREIADRLEAAIAGPGVLVVPLREAIRDLRSMAPVPAPAPDVASERLARCHGDDHTLHTLPAPAPVEAPGAQPGASLPCPVCDDGIEEKCPRCGRDPGEEDDPDGA